MPWPNFRSASPASSSSLLSRVKVRLLDIADNPAPQPKAKNGDRDSIRFRSKPAVSEATGAEDELVVP